MSLRENKEKVKGIQRSDVILYIAVFFVTFLAVILILCIGRIKPFGENSLLDIRAENSILDLFFGEDGTVIPQVEAFADQELSEIQDSMEYAGTVWSFREWAQDGEVSWLYSLLWAGCAGLAAVCCLLLLKRWISGDSPVLLAGAAAYGLCSWLPACLSQPLWAVVMALAPLVLIGAGRICRGKKPVFYVAAAAILLIGGIALKILADPEGSILTWSSGEGLKDILARMLPAQALSKDADGINISMGILAFVFLPVYFCNCRISQKKRALSGAVLALAVFGLDCTGLWYGSSASVAFGFCLLVVLLGCQGLAKWEGVPVFCALLAAGNAVLLILIARSEASEAVPVWFYAVAVAALGILLLESSKRPDAILKVPRFPGMLLLALLILADSVGNLACVCMPEAGETAESVGGTSGSEDTGNPMMLPIAFCVSAEAEIWTVTDPAKPVQSQNEILKSVCERSDNIYEKLGASLFSYGNCTLQEGDGWDETLFQTTDIDGEVYFHYVWECTVDGTYYLENNFRSGSITVKSGNGTTRLTVFDDGASWLCLDELEVGSSVEVEVSIEGEEDGWCGMDLYYLQSGKWEEVWEQLSAEAFCADGVSADEISGTMTVGQNESLLVTLPQAEEWEIFCDDEEADTTVLASGLLLVDAGEGTHEMTFTMQQ